jgi:23S rRNA pseudouridine1911/1915/1917 synthase
MNGQSVKASMKCKNTMEVVVDVPEPEPTEVIPQDIEIDIVYEDDDVIVVNKPAGMVVHPGAGNPSGTLINGLVQKIDEGVGEPMRPGIVHRIDKDTSGLLVVTKTKRAFECLKSQFKDHSIERRYWAVVWGEVTAQTIDKPLGRHPTRRVKFAVVDDGKRAVTHITPLGQGIPAQSGKGGLVSLVECRLETGRTHQIRVHMESIGHPLLGDPFYGRKGDPTAAWKPVVAEINGQLLHAKTLGFQHPNGEWMSFDSEIPREFQTVLDFARVQQ